MTYRINRPATQADAGDAKKLAAYLKYCATNNLTPSASVVAAESSFAEHPDNGSSIVFEQSVCGLNAAQRITGRATRYEEKLLRTIDKKTPALLDTPSMELLAEWRSKGPTLAFRDLYQKWEQWFLADGWSAFDNDQAALFDELIAEYRNVAVIDKNESGAFQITTFGTKPTVQAKLDRAASDAGDQSHKVLDKVPSRYETGPDTSYPPKEILAVYDGVNRSQSPAKCAAILNHWRKEHPETDYPDYRKDGTGLIQSKWTPPRDHKPTRHAADIDELNPLLLYRDYQAFGDHVKTNFFLGDNDSYQDREKEDAPVPKRNIECELETRPSVEEIKSILATHPACYRDGFRFNTATNYDPTYKFSKHRGEMTHYMSGGIMRPVVDRFGTPFGPKPTSKQRASSKNVTKLKPTERNHLEQKARNRWKRLSIEHDSFPNLPPTTMTLNEARSFCGLRPNPANDNCAAAMPWKAPPPVRMVRNGITGQANQSQTSQAMSAGGPENVLIRLEEKQNFDKALSELSSEDIQILDSTVYAANFAQVGFETGDADKSKKTQERNGQRKARQATANLTVLLKNAA